MPILASDVLIEARGMLNDPSGAIYVTAPMLTLMNKVYRELQTKVSSYGVSTTKEISTTVPVFAGNTHLGDGSGLPNFFLYPILLQERRYLSSDQFIDMDEMEFEPANIPSTRLQYWSWREDELKFPAGCSVDMEILIRYVQSFNTISGINSPILILNSQQWMAQRLASVASLVLGSNPSRADALNKDLVEIWDDLRITMVRRKQSIPVRRRRTRYRAR
jgi:hypothetical protein